ncbi:hypothetical protein CHS0354_019696 [Potamilus streckersoni]|uniref:tRNA-queuosine alpha-mannosyltransferase n=1 Tax=Potamilus streckersoni TaxID=2493646 RepID=A0AAE0S9N8_9BIVA|nr:hypothetical protein CHS0354_019696 [Potamilus streckersoni]
MSKENNILLLDPFYAGSHKQLSDLLYMNIVGCERFVLSGKKWHWRARTAALVFSQMIPKRDYRVLFTSSVLNLSELVALRPDLSRLKKIVYFHENQLVYPVRKHQDRDFQYGYNQILTCLVADVIVFNSQYNIESFLSSINSFLKLMPDYRPKGLANTFRPKCQVISFPLEISEYATCFDDSFRTDVSLSEIKNSVDAYTTNICDQEGWDTVAIQTSLQCSCYNSCTLSRNMEGESVFDRTCYPDIDLNRTCNPDTYIDRTCHPDKDIDRTCSPDTDINRTCPPDIYINRTCHPDIDINRTCHPDTDINRTCPPDIYINRTCPPDIYINRTCPPDIDINRTCHPDTDINRTCHPDTDINRTCHPDIDINMTCHPDTDINTKECLAAINMKFDDGSYVKQDYSDDPICNTLTCHKDSTESCWDGSNNCRIEKRSYTKERNFENCDTPAIPPCLSPPGKGSFMNSFHIVWPHRWEHDKDPETFFKVMFQLHDEGLDFHLSVIGEQYSVVPAIFEEARQKLSAQIRTWGYQEKKPDYYRVLEQADCVVSTALHEFFGVAMLEAVYFKCYPLCPNRLVYPEIFPETYLYNTPNQLYKRLREFCRRPHLARSHNIQVDVEKYMWKTLRSEFENLLCK